MRIHSLSKVLSFPFILAIGYILVYMFNKSSNNSAWIFLPGIALAIIYVFHGQIDHWWLEKYPIQLDQKLVEWLEKYSPFYNTLDEVQKKEYQRRMALYLNAREFKAVGTKENRDVPYDIRAAIASQGIQLGFGFKDYLLGDMDRVYIYKHPFPTPRNEFLHTLETHIEDGIIILSLPHSVAGIIDSTTNYNIVMHAYADAFININKKITFPKVENSDWPILEKIIGLEKSALLKTTGFEDLPLLPVHIVAFFQNRETYATAFPNKYRLLTRSLRQEWAAEMLS